MLGAGLGTRLRPLTDSRPKPLVPIFQKPLITFALDHLIAAGVGEFVINTHHLASQFEELFGSGEYRGHRVALSHEPDLLETGGGIKRAQNLIGDQPFIVYSGDILTDIDIGALVDEHFQHGNEVTLALRDTGFAPSIGFRDGLVTDIRKGLGSEGRYDFANVSVWNPSIFERIPAGEKISFVPILVDWIARGGRVGGVVLNERGWFNIGSRKEYLDVHRTIFSGGWLPSYLTDPGWPKAISPSACVAATASIRGFSVVGAGAEIGDQVELNDTIVWDHAKIASRANLESCIVRDGRRAEGILRAADI